MGSDGHTDTQDELLYFPLGISGGNSVKYILTMVVSHLSSQRLGEQYHYTHIYVGLRYKMNSVYIYNQTCLKSPVTLYRDSTELVRRCEISQSAMKNAENRPIYFYFFARWRCHGVITASLR